MGGLPCCRHTATPWQQQRREAVSVTQEHCYYQEQQEWWRMFHLHCMFIALFHDYYRPKMWTAVLMKILSIWTYPSMGNLRQRFESILSMWNFERQLMLKYCDIHLFEICCIIVNNSLSISTSLQIRVTWNLCIYLIIIVMDTFNIIIIVTIIIIYLLDYLFEKVMPLGFHMNTRDTLKKMFLKNDRNCILSVGSWPRANKHSIFTSISSTEGQCWNQILILRADLVFLSANPPRLLHFSTYSANITKWEDCKCYSRDSV